MNALVLAAFVALAPPGSVFRAAAEGWSAQFPAGWMSRAENGVVVAGHNTEAGLLVLRFELGATRETLAANAAQGIAADGAVLALRAPARTITHKAHGAGADAAAVAAEFDGFAADGSVLAASAIGVVGKAGAVTVLGVTSPQHLPALTARILAVASSVAFFAPKRAPAAAPAAAASGAVGALRGALCAYSGGSTMSTTTRANFVGAGPRQRERDGWNSQRSRWQSNRLVRRKQWQSIRPKQQRHLQRARRHRGVARSPCAACTCGRATAPSQSSSVMDGCMPAGSVNSIY
jgi:hypothetical protein